LLGEQLMKMVRNQPLTAYKLATLARRLKVPVPLLKVLRDLCRGRLPRETFGLKVHHGFPEAGATNGKTDKTGHVGSRLEPVKYACLTGSTPQHNEANVLTTIAVCDLNDLLAISALIQPFDFPDIWFHPCLSQFLYGLDHEARPKLGVIGVFIVIDMFKLMELSRDKEFKQK
jgi:hypothetical protein